MEKSLDISIYIRAGFNCSSSLRLRLLQHISFETIEKAAPSRKSLFLQPLPLLLQPQLGNLILKNCKLVFVSFHLMPEICQFLQHTKTLRVAEDEFISDRINSRIVAGVTEFDLCGLLKVIIVQGTQLFDNKCIGFPCLAQSVHCFV